MIKDFKLHRRINWLTSSKQRVRNFLIEFKQLMVNGKFKLLGNRRKNYESLTQLGITKQIRKECIFNLAVYDYCKGPEFDDSGSGNIWIFGIEIDNHEIYIKLKIDEAEGEKIAKCFSFHISNYQLHYPNKL